MSRAREPPRKERKRRRRAGGGVAQFTVYTSQAAFEAATSNRGIDTFDDLTLAQASVVPEPSTYLLLAAGLGGLRVVARRRRSSV